MYCIGLTGNIASGKSTVAAYFAALGVDVLSADQIARDLTKSTQPAFHAIVTHFGKAALTAKGELNRRYLRHFIFQDAEERSWLEQLLHPLIRKRIEHDIGNLKSPYCLIEIPLLTDKSNYPYLNRILLVKTQVERQVSRLMARDNSSKEDALAILATQTNEMKLQAMADDIVENSGSLSELQENIAALHKRYLQDSLSHKM